jgi:cytochrome c biogenesis protein CcmG/thiol:disulfide interchange protein DsbE
MNIKSAIGPLYKLFLLTTIVAMTISFAIYSKRYIDSQFSILDRDFILKKVPLFTAKKIIDNQIFGNENLKNIISSRNNKFTEVVFHFWATWCSPCVEEFPELISYINQDYSINFSKVENGNFVGLNREKNKSENRIYILFAINESVSRVRKFVSSLKSIPENTILLYSSDDSLLRDFGIVRIPETLVFNSDLSLIQKLSGPQKWMTEDPFLVKRF